MLHNNSSPALLFYKITVPFKVLHILYEKAFY